MKKVQFTETVLRDANQSLIATRLPYSDFEPILETIDSAGFYSIECWGGATFDVCLRFLGEDPWERLRKIREKVPNTKLQMLLRGQNILGYKHYPDDIVRRFVRCAVKNGIDIIRIFDALNDTDNLKVAIDETKKCGAVASGAISYTTSPVHTNAKYVEIVKELKEMGVDTVCIKDMAGIMTPAAAYDLVSAIKDAVDLPVVIHTHCTDLKEDKLYAIADYFKPVRAKFLESGKLNPISMGTDTQCLNYQIPGGMLSNLLSQLKSLNSLDKFDEALAETPKVRKDMGYPPLVTPTSQLIGTQAVQNVLAGERYKNVGAELKAYCRGEYGRTPAPIDPEIREKILAGDKIVEGRYADTLPTDTFEKAAEKLGDTAKCEEDVLSYISFPPVAEKFFEERKAKEEKIVKYTITEA